jgi:hypothetical protein
MRLTNVSPRAKFAKAALACIPSIALFAWAACPAPAAAKTIEFRFKPTNGGAYLQHTKMTRRNTPAGADAVVDVAEWSANLTVKKFVNGYSLNSKPIKWALSRNGVEEDPAFVKRFSSVEIVHLLDLEGRLRDVRNLENVLGRFDERYPRGTVRSLEPLLMGAVVNRPYADWDGNLATLAGRNVEIGDVVVSKARVSVPGFGDMPFYAAMKFVEWVGHQGIDCVRIEIAYNSNPEALRPIAGNALREFVAEGDQGSSIVQLSAGVELTGTGEWIIDPATMDLYAEKVSRRIDRETTAAGIGPVMNVVEETREYSIEKLKAPEPSRPAGE